MIRRLSFVTYTALLLHVIVLPALAIESPARRDLIGTHHRPDFVDVHYKTSRRDQLICRADTYRATVDIVHPALQELYAGEAAQMLGNKGLWMELEDANGTLYTSRDCLKKSRQNTWRAGLYYYDAHLLDFYLTSADGNSIPVRGELVFHCFPDKINVQAIFHAEQNLTVKRAELLIDISDCRTCSQRPLVVSRGSGLLGLAGGKRDGGIVRAAAKTGTWQTGRDYKAHLALFPGGKESLQAIKNAVTAELNPLSDAAFSVRGGAFQGYDAGRGLYIIRNTVGGSAQKGFEGFWNNPNMYLGSEIRLTNDRQPRRLYIMHEMPVGPVEAGILTDLHGFPLGIPVQACKNFGGEKEEPDDTGFSETYFPVEVAAGQTTEFRSLHLYQNWGNHTLRQVSSIRFFQIYYHLSQGVTETTCFSLPTKFGALPDGQRRAYTIADYRPLSGQTFIGQPQHHHVALQGWLQYLDENNLWQWPVYKGSTLLSVGPNLAWFIQEYESSDGKVSETVEVLEMPQDDELRTFVRIRYDFTQTVNIGGDPRHNLRLLNKGSYIRRVHWKQLSWLDRHGRIRTVPFSQDGQYSAEAIPIRPFNSFFCAYPHVEGNDSVVVRSFTGRVNGTDFDKLGFSAIGHKNNMTELMLVPLIEGNIIRAGSWMELDCILIPYGDDSSGYRIPWQESIRFGLNQSQLERLISPRGHKTPSITTFGPEVQVSNGRCLSHLPPVVRAEDNWAEFTLEGGHDRISLVAAGFRARKLPMLWEDDAYIDTQVRGGDGYQVFRNADGTYGFVFAPRTRTTRVSDNWKTTRHHYYVTQAVSQADIVRVNTPNAEVELVLEGEGQTVIDSPRIWCPATNYLKKSRRVNQARSTSLNLCTIPAALSGAFQTAEWTITTYDSTGFKMSISPDQAATIHCSSLTTEKNYEIRVNGKKTIQRTSPRGQLRIEVPGGRRTTIIGSAAPA